MSLFKNQTRVAMAYTNKVGDKVYPVIVDIKKGIKSTEDIQFVSSDVNTGILSVAFIQGNDNYNVSGAEVVCSVMRPDASTLELPCEVVGENIVEVPLGINGTSQDGIYSFDFKVFKGGNKVVGTPIMNYSVSLSISNDNAVLEDDRLPVLTMLMTQLTDLKGEARETINQANAATVSSREATANAIAATNNANAVSERVSQETSEAISRVDNKVNEVETRFNALTSSQQQDAEVIDARTDFKGVVFDSLKERIDYTDKLLRESTVSTVTTESDFTTVEATSNGYFEDVKLEGKTLVNLGGKVRGTYNKYNTLLNSIRLLAPNSEYTFIVSNTAGHNVDLYINEVIFNNQPTFTVKANSTSIISCTTKDIVNQLSLLKSASNDGTIINLNVILLEGDHTQNPPSYFEGLKSVGQDVDEIVVSSVKGDGNLIKSRLVFNDNEQVEGFSSVYRQFKIPVIKGRIYYLKAKVQTNSNWKDSLCRLYHQSKPGTHTVIYVSTYNNNNDLVDIDISFVANDDYVVFEYYNNPALDRDKNIYDNFDYLCLTSNPNLNPNNDLVLDKKRLLYYNEETQTWEKPILREWDSIEKHTDGKYYYHQRSGEVVLNGSEGWGGNYVFENTGRWACQIPNIRENSLLVCDKFIYKPNNSDGAESIFATSKLLLTLSNDKGNPSTWLQTNNVTVVYQLAEEKVYECTNIDLITYANETNYIVESGAIVPRTTLKVHNNISNVVKILQEKVSLLESNVKASQEVQDMMILETDMRMLGIELALMEFMPMTLNLGGSSMLRSATYFNFVKNHIINETYEKEYLENVMNKYLATGRINQDEYDELYKMLYPPVYDIELPIEL